MSGTAPTLAARCRAFAKRSGLIRMVCCLVCTLVVADSLPAQQAVRVAGCYRFDRAYFGQLGMLPGATATQSDNTAIVRLHSAGVSPADTVYQQLIPRFTLPHAGDALGRPRFPGEAAYWRPLDRDSVEISWFSGFHGPLFRLEIRGDSLTGTVVMRTDILYRDPATGRPAPHPEESASAVRVACDLNLSR